MGLKMSSYHNPYKVRADRPTDGQLREISRLIQAIERNNLPIDGLLYDDSYKRNFSAAVSMIRTLRDFLYTNCPQIPLRKKVYINRCRHKQTGKMINYRTTTWMGAPKGYECLGMLRSEIIEEGGDEG